MDRHEYVFGERRINEKVICASSGFSGYFADPDGYLWEIACDLESYSKEMAVILEFDRGEFLKVYWDAGEAIHCKAIQREVETIYNRLTQHQLANYNITLAVETAVRWMALAPLNEAAYRHLI